LYDVEEDDDQGDKDQDEEDDEGDEQDPQNLICFGIQNKGLKMVRQQFLTLQRENRSLSGISYLKLWWKKLQAP
jgi:hypothetical protein